MNISDILTSALYSNSVATIAIIVSFIAVPASGYLSYHFAIKGERRKEFNAVADGIRPKLREHLSCIEYGAYPSGLHISVTDEDFNMLVDVSYKRERKKLKDRIDRYQLALQNSFRVKENGDYEQLGLDDAKTVLFEIISLIERK